MNIGDRVIFTPNPNRRLGWAAGIRTVAGFYGKFIRLECGNITLLASPEELEKVEQKSTR